MRNISGKICTENKNVHIMFKGTEEKRGTTFRSSTDEIVETLTGNYEIR